MPCINLLFHAEKAVSRKKALFSRVSLVLMLIRNSQIDVDIYRKNGELYERFLEEEKKER